MEVKDLRIGNHVSFNDVWCKVIGIDKDRVLVEYHNGDTDYCHIDYIEPIELTGDILIKTGFFKRSYHEIYFITPCVGCYDYYISYQNIKDNKYSFVASGYKNGELKRRIRLDNIKYLHELQNIFFSFTNQELEMKL